MLTYKREANQRSPKFVAIKMINDFTLFCAAVAIVVVILWSVTAPKG